MGLYKGLPLRLNEGDTRSIEYSYDFRLHSCDPAVGKTIHPKNIPRSGNPGAGGC